MLRSDLQLFTTCPQSTKCDPPHYLDQVRAVAEWSDRHGYTGMLIYYDHSLVDPWLVAAEVLRATTDLSPLVAVQPAAMHPHSVAKMVASLSSLYSRRVHLNMIAGGFAGDLRAIGDETPHDDRYSRLQAFAEIVMGLASGQTLTRSDDWYNVEALRLEPAIPESLRPGLLMSGSSPVSIATAAALGATAVHYPQPAAGLQAVTQPSGVDRQPEVPNGLATGIRVGIIAREHSEEAWRVAHDRFPPSRRGQMLHEMAMQRSDSQWHRTLSELAEESARQQNAYWLGPFQQYDTFCPYLVGSYDEVAVEVLSYWNAGHRTMILDIPPSEDELVHTGLVVDRAETLAKRHPTQEAS